MMSEPSPSPAYEKGHVFRRLSLKGIAVNEIPVLGELLTIADIFTTLEVLTPRELSAYLESRERYIRKERSGGGFTLKPRFDFYTAWLELSSGMVPRVLSRIAGFLRGSDAKNALLSIRKNRDEAVQIVKSVICHDYIPDASALCVSTNANTLLPSFRNAHVERLCASSYITRYFDIFANGKKTRIQIWKGHLAALNFTGAEISVWKPFWSCYLWYDDDGLPHVDRLVDDRFGLLWYPFEENQLQISWQLVDSSMGDEVIRFGGSPYEEEMKWWAGKWRDHGEMKERSKFGKDYTVSFFVSDNLGHTLRGEWRGTSCVNITSTFPRTEDHCGFFKRSIAR